MTKRDYATNCPIPLRPGDIVAVEGRWPWTWVLSHMIDPPTRSFHYLVICQYASDHYDPETVESIHMGIGRKHGVCSGRLSYYRGQHVQIYRARSARDAWSSAIVEFRKDYGRSGYDWPVIPELVIKAAIRLPWAWAHGRKLRAKDIPYKENRSLVCTEAAAKISEYAGCPIVPKGVPPIPNSMMQGLRYEGKWAKLWEGIL